MHNSQQVQNDPGDRGQQVVVLAGRFALAPRNIIVRRIREQDWQLRAKVDNQTTLVVLGSASLPTRPSGKPLGALSQARERMAAGQAVMIIGEREFLARLGFGQPAPGAITLSDAGRLLGLHRDQLRRWVEAGLVTPVPVPGGQPSFDFAQLASLRHMQRLIQAGVSPRRIYRSLHQVSAWLRKTHQPAQHFVVAERQARLLVRLEDGRRADPRGQLHLDFIGERDEPRDAALLSLPNGLSWFERACALEERGDLPAAAAAYRESLRAEGPDATAAFNLANVLSALGQLAAAAERYWQAVELDPEFGEAWNNLGATLIELGNCHQAVEALERALQLEPELRDALYNLADCLERNGRHDESKAYWRRYVELDPESPWGQYARQQLEAQPASSAEACLSQRQYRNTRGDGAALSGPLPRESE